MIFIADGGSGKTDWLCWDGKRIAYFRSPGINPNQVSGKEAAGLVASSIPKKFRKAATRIFYYGAGCGTVQNCRKMKKVLAHLFPDAIHKIDSDLKGAAIAGFGGQTGLACILGTGANSGMYNGKKITGTVPSLGFFLAEEGSGNWIGRQLLDAYFSHTMPSRLASAFHKTFHPTVSAVRNQVYNSSHPSAYLASFAPFALRYRKNAFIQGILRCGFTGFTRRYILPLAGKKRPSLHFTGSIAWFFRIELSHVLNELGFKKAAFTRSPLEGLALYHFKGSKA